MPPHSHGEKLSLNQFWRDLDQADRQARAWLEGPKITQQDLSQGSARVEKLTVGNWWAGTKSRGSSTPATPPATTGARTQSAGVSRAGAVPCNQGSGGGVRDSGKVKPLIMMFGKAKGQLAVDVRENDPHYWRWLIENVESFAKKAREAGLA